jgi:uncharacterized protein (DUF58 family)
MIMPLMWLLLAGLALVLGWATAVPLFSWIGYLMVALLLVGLSMTRLGCQGLSARRDLSVDRIRLGDRVVVDVRVENRSLLPALWMAAAESLPVGLPVSGARGRVLPFAWRRGSSFSYTLEGARRGYHEIGPTVIRTGDLFGLFQRQARCGGSSWLTVYPKIVALEHALLPSRRSLGEIRTRQRALEDPTQTVGIRPYQRGDSLRRVHWRATAHTGKLQSKLFELTAQPDVTVVLNLNRADYPANPDDAVESAELAITTAASIAQHVLDREQRLGLLALARDPAGAGPDRPLTVKPGRGRAQLISLLSVLGRIELGQCDRLVKILDREKERFPWGTMVVVITPKMDRDCMLALIGLRTAGFALELILAARGVYAPGRADMGMIGISAARVQSEEDIRGLDL